MSSRITAAAVASALVLGGCQSCRKAVDVVPDAAIVTATPDAAVAVAPPPEPSADAAPDTAKPAESHAAGGVLFSCTNAKFGTITAAGSGSNYHISTSGKAKADCTLTTTNAAGEKIMSCNTVGNDGTAAKHEFKFFHAGAKPGLTNMMGEFGKDFVGCNR